MPGAVAPNTDDVVVIPDGYRQSVVISWGDPILPGAPAFDVAKQTAAAQRGQFGFNDDFAGLLPIPGSAGHFLLITNHEYTTEQFMHPGYDADAPTREQFAIAIAAQGPNRGETKQFLTVPLGAETCGPVVTDDLVTVCVQHPGESDGNSVDDPLSRWPEGDDGTARPSVVVVWRDAGQIGV